MATIRQVSGNFRAHIRKKGIELSATFKHQEDAELWALYKEDLIDSIQAFDMPLKEGITLQDAIELKMSKIEINSSKKEFNEYTILLKFFEEFCPKSIGDIKYVDLVKCYEEKIKTPIYRGGTGKNDETGIKKLPSHLTILKKFAYLSTIYQMLIEDGVDLENIALKVMQFIKKSN